MGWLKLITCCLFVASVASRGERGPNGILYDNTAKRTHLWDPIHIVRNRDFPKFAPPTMVQTWRYLCDETDGQRPVFEIKCRRVSVHPAPDRRDCGEFLFTIEDGGKKKEFCGEPGAVYYLSETNEIKLTLRTSPIGGGIVDCTAQAVPINSDGQIITTTTTTTTTTPKPTRPAYFSLESYEVDSSEHGGEPGSKATTCPCGWANKFTSRIVNGSETARNEFPFAVGLVERGGRWRFCGGTIITRYHVLTAAHCTAGQTADHLSVIVGIHNVEEDYSGPADDIPVEMIIDHHEYSRQLLINDISLLVLEREIEFSQLVGPACLPPPSPKLALDRQYIKIVGWGAGVFFGPQSPVLQKVDVRVVPMKECQYMYSQINVDNPTQICTYAKKKASCQGDSGGPVVWVDPETNRYTHVGIVSYGRVCGDESPSVHTSVQAYLDWIYHFIKATNKPNAQTCTKV